MDMEPTPVAKDIEGQRNEPASGLDPRRVSRVPPPPMVVVYKGWWKNLPTERQAADLEREDRERRTQP